jgi:hypothetical protein
MGGVVADGYLVLATIFAFVFVWDKGWTLFYLTCGNLSTTVCHPPSPITSQRNGIRVVAGHALTGPVATVD